VILNKPRRFWTSGDIHRREKRFEGEEEQEKRVHLCLMGGGESVIGNIKAPGEMTAENPFVQKEKRGVGRGDKGLKWPSREVTRSKKKTGRGPIRSRRRTLCNGQFS